MKNLWNDQVGRIKLFVWGGIGLDAAALALIVAGWAPAGIVALALGLFTSTRAACPHCGQKLDARGISIRETTVCPRCKHHLGDPVDQEERERWRQAAREQWKPHKKEK